MSYLELAILQNQASHLDNLVLVTGGAKSGKSALAESLATESNSNVYYLATMPRIADDSELNQKIKAHKDRRPETWQTKEESLKVDSVIDSLTNESSVCIVDCLSAYVSNLMFANQEKSDDILITELKNSLERILNSVERKSEIEFIFVTNEVGWSIVPNNKVGRTFRELLGIANQMTANASNNVYLCCSGISVKIKSGGKAVFN